MGLAVVEDHSFEGLAADGAGAVGAVFADDAASKEDFSTLGGFHHLGTGIAILDVEDLAAAVRAFDRLATHRDGFILDGHEFLEVVVVYLQESA